MYVLHVPTDDAHTYIEELPVAMSTFLLLYVRMHCITLYSCTYWCTYAPTAHTAVPTDVRTYPPHLLLSKFAISTRLLHKAAVRPVRVYCCTYS